MKIQNTFLWICILLVACNNPHHSNDSKTFKPKDSIYTEPEKTLNNEYTKVVLSLCKDVFKYKFTNLNTEYFDLNIHKDLDCFAFSSEVVCGGPMGSCGLNIQIFRKTEKGYAIAFETCGNHIRESIESNFGYKSFTYETREGFKYKVFYNGKKFEEKPITINGLNYNKIKLISKAIDGRDIRTFYPETSKSEDNSGNAVSIEDFNLGPKSKAELYIVKLAPTHYFLFENDELIFNTSDILSMEPIVNKSKEYYDIKIFSMDNYTMNVDTSYLLPVLYRYSKRLGKYEILDK